MAGMQVLGTTCELFFNSVEFFNFFSFFLLIEA